MIKKKKKSVSGNVPKYNKINKHFAVKGFFIIIIHIINKI